MKMETKKMVAAAVGGVITGAVTVGLAGVAVIRDQVAPRATQMQREADLRDKIIAELKKGNSFLRDELELSTARNTDDAETIKRLMNSMGEANKAMKKLLDEKDCQIGDKPSIFEGGDRKFDYPQRK